MPHFFVKPEQIHDGIVMITGDDAHHISRSLRMASGDSIVVSDNLGKEYYCSLEKFEDGIVTAKIDRIDDFKSEPPYRAHLFQALPKGDKLDYIIQKSVECGVNSITTFDSDRCIAKDKKDDMNRILRRQRIATEAAKQSGRGILPKVLPTVSFNEMLDLAGACDLVLFCYEGEGTVSLRQSLNLFNEKQKNNNFDVAIIIGSEGGFSLTEVEKAKQRGFCLTGLGNRILRTETASGFVLSSLSYEYEL